MNLVFCVLVMLTGPSQTRGQSRASPPVLSMAAFLSSASPDLTEDPGDGVSQRTHGQDEPSTETTTVTETQATIHAEAATHAVDMTQSAAAPPPHSAMTAPSPADHLSSAAPGRSSAAAPPGSTSDGSAVVTSTTQPQHESWTSAPTRPTAAGRPLISAPGRGPAGPTYQEVPSELNVGDEDLKGPRSRSVSPLDPLLAGLLSVFIVTTALVFVILFLKFRQRTSHPEFHRLQDLPMDDLMEDTPLSRYTY